MGLIKKILLSALCEVGCSVFAAGFSWDVGNYVKVNINSGNPAFPYPQFLEYKKGKTLAKYNAEGVTHADMEKAGREAYEIMSHRCRYDGGTHCGVPYITFNNFRKLGDDEMPQGGAEFCTEGDGYMMLAAALFADQATFNGLWMWIHDNRIPHRVRYQDGKVRLPNYEFGGGLPICYAMEGSTSENHGSATDGDDDIAMALLVACKQWGDTMKQDGKVVLDYSGKPILYKEACEDFLKAFVDTFAYTSINGDGTLYNGGHMSGNIGVDGYVKGGNKGKEVSSWRNTQTTYPDISQFSNISGGGGDGNTHTDYCAPAYYNEFAKWLESGVVNATDWQINQYKRAEASSDWLCGEAFKQGLCSSIGTTNMATDGKPTFTNFSEGEDFRSMWRLAQNYLWHGEPEYNWNPTTHQVEKGTNTNEYDMALRTAKIMKEPPALDGSGIWCGKLGASPDPGQPSFQGPSQIKMCYNINGGVLSHYGANYALGASAPAIVLSEDLDLIADMYRQSELMWDDASGESSSLTDDERYILSMPKYFHGWFRVMAMLTHTGNWHAASDMVSAANMKVYMSVDKTYAYVDDKIGYTVQYRNYGSADAKNVTITTEIDPNYEVVSISNGGKFSAGRIVWNIGNVPGFKSGKLEQTIDSVSFTVIAKDTLNPRICLTSTISGTNFEDWTSNEYPNHATYTMERNCVDILANRTLMIKKTANRTKLNPNDAVVFTVNFSNSSDGGEASWMNGGRDHVNMSYGNTIMESYGFRQFYRFWNDAHEAYIDLGNYRMSYFMNDGAAIGLYDPVENPTGWTFQLDNGNDMTKYGWMPAGANTKFTYQKLPIGSDEHGKWNQRIMIQFPKTLMATTTHVYDKLDSKYLLHKGGWGPCFFRTVLKTNPAQEVPKRVADDWSYDASLEINNLDGQAQIYTLITPNYADYDNLGYPVTQHSRYACEPLNCDNFDRVLVEEFDGYTWRRIIGRGPLPGREAYDVTVIDTIPYELEWVGWKDSTALKNDAGEKIKATYTPASNPKSAGYTGIVKWTVPVMLVGEEDKLVYMCKARDLGCPDVEDTYYFNVAWISSKTDSPDSSRVELMTTCAELPPQVEPQDALFKKADKKMVMPGESVSYEVKFKNTLGTSVDVNCKSTDNIIKLGNGILPTVGDAGFKLQTKGDGTPYFFAHDHCYGKNGEVYFTVHNGSNNQETYIVFRYEGGTPGKADFKGVAMQIMVNKDGNQNFGFYLYNNGTLIEKQGTSWQDSPIQFPGSNKDVKFKFVLNSEKMYMYINDEDDEWSNVLKDWSGLTASGPGYFGAYVNSNGNADCQLSQFQTNLDYAFEIEVSDLVPEELTDITNISDGGTYDASKHTVTWPMIGKTTKDAMAPGDSVVYTFDATVESCGKFVNNYAMAKVYGLDTLKVLNTIECGEEEIPEPECDIDSVQISISAEEICKGDSVLLKAKVFPKATKEHTFEFFMGKETSLTDGEAITADSFYVKEEGTYWVMAYNENIEGCKKPSSRVKLTVGDLPDESLKENVALCSGDDLSLSDLVSEGYIVKWYADKDTLFALESIEIKGEDVANNYYYTLTDEKTGCMGDIQKLDVKKGEMPSAPTTENAEYPVSSGAKKDITGLGSAPTGAHIVWYETETAKDSTKTPIYVSLDEDAEKTYYVSSVSDDLGCESERVAIKVTITSSNKPKTENTTVCKGTTVDVTTLVEEHEAGSELVWYADAEGTTKTEAPEPMTFENVGETEFYVAQTNGVATSDVATITVTVMDVAKIKAEAVKLCAGETASPLKVTVDSETVTEFTKVDKETSFEWRLDGVKLTDEKVVPNTAVSKTTESVYSIMPVYTIVNGSEEQVCKGDTVHLNVTVTAVDEPTVSSSINYTLMDVKADDTYENLTNHAPNTVKADEDMMLVWYDEDGDMIGDGTTAPAPPYDATMTSDKTFTYYVSQKNADGCESKQTKVTVIVSKTPVPTPSVAYFCQDEPTVRTLEDYVTPTPGYTLIWYSDDPKEGGVETSMPTFSTTMTDPEATDEVSYYYVAQEDETGTRSSAVAIEVHILCKPTLITHNDTVCNKPVNLDALWKKSNAVKDVFAKFFDDDNNEVTTYTAVDKTGMYHVQGYFTSPIECYGKAEDIYAEIHKIESLTIEGDKTTCPGMDVDLKATVDGETYSNSITYTWSETNKATDPSNGDFKSEALNAPTTFTVTATDGYCTETAKHSVTIDKGSVNGTVSFSETGNNMGGEAILVDGSSEVVFYSCGGDVTVTTALKNTNNDFKWSNGQTGESMTTSAEGSYTLTFTNKCETSQKVRIVNAGVTDKTSPADLALCEGEKGSLVVAYDCPETPTIVWTKDGTEVATSEKINISSAKSEDAGLYAYTITNRGCVVKNNYGTVKVYPKPVYELLPVSVICANSSIEIGLASLTPETAKVTWETSPTLTPAGITAMASPSDDETYSFTITQDGGCAIKEKVMVAVSDPVVFTVSPKDTAVCQNSGDVKVRVNVTKGNALSYSWTNKDGAQVSTSNLLKVPTSTIGSASYMITLTTEACGEFTDMVSVEVVGSPIVDTVIQRGYRTAEIVMNETAGQSPYKFVVDGGAEQEDYEINDLKYGGHTLDVVDANGCKTSTKFNTTAPDVDIPTLVTPGQDGSNDLFKSDVLSEAYPDAKMTIYDRYGKVVAEVSASDGWDGTYNGHKMPSTDYWYEIWVEEIRVTYVGHFTLINN